MVALLEVTDLKKSFGQVPALSGVTFSVEPGERVALLGPNGAGKTTLIRCLCGLAAPDSGRIVLLGTELPRSGERLGLGLVPQELALYHDLTARENLQAFGRCHGLRGRRLRERVRWALEWTHLSDRADDLVGGFSGGMKRRINIACGVLHEPRLLLLDEPTVGVDPQSRERIYAMLELLAADGTALLLTTHHLDEAESQCERIVIIDRGRVAAVGTLNELIQRTVGPARQVRLQVEEEFRSDVPGWRWDPRSRRFDTRIDDVANQLPMLLQRIAEAGYSVSDVEVHAPRLHQVFIHLTGHALRE